MPNVKGILLCGGEGTRLYPLTSVLNKHLQRIGRKFMLDYPFEKMIEAGITDIHVIVGGEHWASVVKYLGSGRDRGVNVSYSIQDKAGGIAEAIGLARTFAGNDKVCAILGDNLFDLNLRPFVKAFAEDSDPSKAFLFSAEVDKPEKFGVLIRDPEGNAVDIIEKPNPAPSKEVLIGVYFYTPDVFDIIKTCRPSARGELEVTDLNKRYVKNGCAVINKITGRWTDCGSFETLEIAEKMVGSIA